MYLIAEKKKGVGDVRIAEERGGLVYLNAENIACVKKKNLFVFFFFNVG